MHPNDTYRATPTRRRETKTIRVGARQRSASSPPPCSLSRWSLSISYLRISSQKQTHLILERGGYGFIPNPSDDAAMSEDIREAGTRLENHIQENSVCTWRMICWGCKHLYSSMQFTQLDVKHENICVCVQCNERFISCWRRETPHGKLLQFLVTDATKEDVYIRFWCRTRKSTRKLQNPIKAEYLSSISGSFFNLWLKRPLTAETRSGG